MIELIHATDHEATKDEHFRLVVKYIYIFLCLFLISGVANADSVMSTLLFSDPAARFLLTLAEVSVAMTAFAGIAIVIGRRGSNKWTEFDVMRFTTLTVNGVMAVVLCLLPFLLFDPDIQFLEADWEMLTHLSTNLWKGEQAPRDLYGVSFYDRIFDFYPNWYSLVEAIRASISADF